MAIQQPNQDLAIVDGFVLDCVITEEHRFESEVTEYPVESGASITDNIRPRPITVSMEVVVSDTPLPPLSNSRGNGKTIPSIDAYDKLQKIRDDREPVDIVTHLRAYSDMVLKDLSIPLNAATGEALRFTATWQQVEIVSNTRSTRVAIPGAMGGTKPKTINGSLGTTGGSGTIAIAPTAHEWFDTRIGAWRKEAVYAGEPGTVNTIPSTTSPEDQVKFTKLSSGEWQLRSGKPDFMTEAEWYNNTLDQNNAAVNKLAQQFKDENRSPTISSAVLEDNAQRRIILVPGDKVHIITRTGL